LSRIDKNLLNNFLFKIGGDKTKKGLLVILIVAIMIYPVVNANVYCKKNRPESNTLSYIQFVPPYDMKDEGGGTNMEKSEYWYSVDKTTGLIKIVAVCAHNVLHPQPGEVFAYGGLGVDVVAPRTFSNPYVEFIGEYNGILGPQPGFAGYSDFCLYTAIWEDDQLLFEETFLDIHSNNDQVIKTGTKPFDFVINFPRFKQSRHYTIWFYAWVSIHSNGDTPGATADFGFHFPTEDRYISLKKIIVGGKEASDLHVVSYLLSWSGISPGETGSGFIQIENAGDKGSDLDWEIYGWPDWGSWSFNPKSGSNLKPEDGVFTIDVKVKAPNEENKAFHGSILIRNKNNLSDAEVLSTSLTTPKPIIYPIENRWYEVINPKLSYFSYWKKFTPYILLDFLHQLFMKARMIDNLKGSWLTNP